MKRLMKFLVAMLVLPAVSGWATTYYVAAEDPAAGDANTGTEEVRPFKTISAAMAKVQPGDTVLVKNGTYREAVTWTKIDPTAPADVKAGKVTSNGVLETARMTLAAWPGQRPVIKGSEVVTNRFEPVKVALRRQTEAAGSVRDEDFMKKFIGAQGTLKVEAAPETAGETDRLPAAFTGIYACPWTDYPTVAFADDAPLKQIGLQGCVSRQYNTGFRLLRQWDGRDEADMRPGTFYYDAAQKRLYVWLADGGDPNRHVIEAGVRSHGILVQGTWTVRGFDVRHTNDANFSGGFYGVAMAGKGCVIENCRITHNGYVGLQVGGTDALIRNNEIGFNGFNGLVSALGYRFRVENNYFHDNNILGGEECGNVGNKSCWLRDCAFVGNRFRNEPIGIWLDLNCNNMLIAENEFDNCSLGVFFEISRWGVIVNNVFRNCRQAIQTCSSDALVAHNVILGGSQGIVIEVRNGNDGAGAAYRQSHFDKVVDNPSFTNDSCMMAERNNLVVNNVITNTQVGFLTIEPDSSHGSGNYSDYNVYSWSLPPVTMLDQYRFTGNLTSRSMRLAAWRQDRRNDEHSVLADEWAFNLFRAGWSAQYSDFPWEELGSRDLIPEVGFVDAANGDYHLRTDSPVRGRGITLPLELNSTMIPSQTTELNSRAWARTLTISKGDPRFKEPRIVNSWGAENYRPQPLPAIRRLAELDTAAPADPGINFAWRASGQYPRFRSSGAAEMVTDDYGVVYPNNRLQDSGFDRKIGEVWKCIKGRAQIYQSAATIRLASADAEAPLLAQKVGTVRANTEYLAWADIKPSALDSKHGIKAFIGLAAGSDLRRLATTEVQTPGGLTRLWNTYSVRYVAGKDAKSDPNVGQDLYAVFGAVLDGPQDAALTNPVATVSWDKFWLVSGEPPQTETAAKAEVVAPFTLAASAAKDAWQNVDITPQANRPLRGEDCWIGMPLLQLPPGDHVFAGVPFRVLSGDGHDDMACIALRSTRISATRGKPLADRVEIPLRGLAKALYIIHGLGYATTNSAIGKYELIYADGDTSVLPIVSYVKEEEGDNVEARRARSNVQDWWPTFPQFSNEHVRAVALYPPDRNETSKRYIYAVEWVNPHPEKELKAIRATSDPSKEDCLAILGITLLK